MKAKRILIADDDHESRELLSIMAVRQGYEVVGAKDGVHLLSLCADSSFDIIITDLMMNNMNGDSAVETLKQQGCVTPVIALTGRSCHELEHMGDLFVKIFHKPCILKELFAYIATVI